MKTIATLVLAFIVMAGALSACVVTVSDDTYESADHGHHDIVGLAAIH